jgi:hypothetical protein
MGGVVVVVVVVGVGVVVVVVVVRFMTVFVAPTDSAYFELRVKTVSPL